MAKAVRQNREGIIRTVITSFVAASAFAFSAPAVAGDYASAEMADGQVLEKAGVDTGYLYEAGSIAKLACTVAALRLVDRGQIGLDSSIGEVLPNFAETPINGVRLRDLLASRSGMADGLIPAFGRSPQDVMSTPDAQTALMKFATGEVAAQPDSEFSYDLINWIAVQAIIEEVTGKSIVEVLVEEVLQPAAMGESRIFVGAIGENAAPPAGPVRPLPEFLTCAGGLATTPSDLLALARYPHHGGLADNTLAALTTITTPEEGYTLGGRYTLVQAGAARLISWQTGSNGAYKSLVVYDPLTDAGFAAMTASDDNGEIREMRDEWMRAKGLG